MRPRFLRTSSDFTAVSNIHVRVFKTVRALLFRRFRDDKRVLTTDGHGGAPPPHTLLPNHHQYARPY